MKQSTFQSDWNKVLRKKVSKLEEALSDESLPQSNKISNIENRNTARDIYSYSFKRAKFKIKWRGKDIYV